MLERMTKITLQEVPKEDLIFSDKMYRVYLGENLMAYILQNKYTGEWVVYEDMVLVHKQSDQEGCLLFLKHRYENNQ